MKKFFNVFFVLAVSMLAMVAACAPKTATPAAPAATPTATTAKATTPSTSSAEADWAKVVEAAKKEGKVTVYTYGFTGDAGAPVAKAFEDTYGIKIEVVGGTGAALTQRIQSEAAGGKNLADTLDSSPPLVMLAKKSGLTQSIGNLPTLAEKGVWREFPGIDPEGHLIGFVFTYYPIYYNSTLVKESEAPHSWKDLLDSRWKGGRIAVATPLTDPTLPRLYSVLLRDKALDEGYFTKLAAQDLKIVPSARDTPSLLARGEVPIGMTAETVISPFQAQGAPIKMIQPSEGAVSFIGISIAMIKNAPHPNAARVLVNWMLSKEGQLAMAKAKQAVPIRSDVADFSPEKAVLKNAHFSNLESETKANSLMGPGPVAKIFGVDK